MPESLSWSVDLGKDQPRKRLIVIGSAVLACVVAILFTQNIVIAIFSLGIILATCAEVILPTKFELTDEVIRSKCGLSMNELEWSKVKSAWSDKDGIKLSPLEPGARMEGFRGIYLRFANNRDAVVAKIRQHWDGDASLLGNGTDAGEDGGAD